jgi:predicted acetyltransferase
VHELAGFDTDFYRLSPSGQWLPDIVEDWVGSETPVANLRSAPVDAAAQPFQRAHVIVAAGAPVGFVCIGLAPFRYMPPEADVFLAELFVANPFRSRGLARRAVELVLPRYEGRWSLSAIHDNERAIRFWRKTLPALPIRDLVETRGERDVSWAFVGAPRR